LKYKVIYFTRTNTSKRIAGKIADRLSCEAIQITDNIDWKGIIGFIKAGYYSVTDKAVDIKVLGNLHPADEYVVVTPLWAGGIASATRAMLRTIPNDKVHLVVASGGGLLKNRSGYKSVSDITDRINEEFVIDNLARNLLNK
jgi:hypothetical protein